MIRNLFTHKNKNLKSNLLSHPSIDEVLNPSNKYHNQAFIEDIKNLKNLKATQFENFLKTLFEISGYEVKLTPLTYDHGIDLFIKKDNTTYAIQAKGWDYNAANYISVDEVRQLRGVLASSKDKNTNGIIITTTYFTDTAQSEASESPTIQLIDLRRLYQLISELQPVLFASAYFEEIHKPEYCPQCGGMLILRKSKRTRKLFLGCENFPNCKYKTTSFLNSEKK